MAWNPSPKVADCRDIARKWGHQQVIIIALSPDTSKIEMATYGRTKRLCNDAKRLGDATFKAVMKEYGDE